MAVHTALPEPAVSYDSTQARPLLTRRSTCINALAVLMNKCFVTRQQLLARAALLSSRIRIHLAIIDQHGCGAARYINSSSFDVLRLEAAPAWSTAQGCLLCCSRELFELTVLLLHIWPVHAFVAASLHLTETPWVCPNHVSTSGNRSLCALHRTGTQAGHA